MAWVVDGIGAGVCMLAFVKGGPAERAGALLILIAWGFQSLLQSLSIDGFKASLGLVKAPMLFSDFLLATGLLLLALRFASLWLGMAMIAQGGQLGAHAFFIAYGGEHRYIFAVWSNVTSAVLLASLLTGTVTCWRRRVVSRQRAAGALTVGLPAPG